jgi:hypothetical protein
LQLGRLKMDDPQALRDPRPDTGEAESRKLYAWDPVGGGNSALGSRTVGLDITAVVGKVIVSTD